MSQLPSFIKNNLCESLQSSQLQNLRLILVTGLYKEVRLQRLVEATVSLRPGLTLVYLGCDHLLILILVVRLLRTHQGSTRVLTGRGTADNVKASPRSMSECVRQQESGTQRQKACVQEKESDRTHLSYLMLKSRPV